MQIVINIPKKTYKEIQERNIITCGETFAQDLVRRIRNGTPLPEHHGRLIDESKITKCYMPINQLDVRGIRTDAPTIIEGSDSK